jgi:CheY-like chemotaxis protein
MALENPHAGGILIVEDDVDIRETLAEILADEGYSVASAANGLDAIAYLQSETLPAVILLDLMMPVMSGWEFRAKQQQDPRIAPIPVVVLSGDGNIQAKATSLNAAGFLPKPVDLERLLGMVSHYCAS